MPALTFFTAGALCFATSAAAAPAGDARTADRPNVLLITADDLNYDSLGVTGCRVPDITPHLDRLAAQGLRFEHAHVTIAVCQPCRSVLMTGRYPYRNGARGFEPINPAVPTLQESLRAGGYLNGILSKTGHLQPERKFCWDMLVRSEQLGYGRDPALYYRHSRAFFDRAREAGRPFFLMANSQDPHRPFAGSDQEKSSQKRLMKRTGIPFPKASRYYKPDEIEVPGFLPDLPKVRREIAEYYTSVHRCDETVGEVLRALHDSGLEDRTLVMFLSDHGMALPFAKTNCYLNSTRTPWIVRWPGRVEPDTVDREHMISGIDFMPTILEAAGLPQVPGMDGRSFLPLLTAGQQEGRDLVFTVFHQTAAKRDYPMRCVQTRRTGYIWSPWSDGTTVFLNESQSGRSMKAMVKAAETDPAVAARVKLFQYRVPEELYDLECDPCALHNLIDDPAHRRERDRLRSEMLRIMESTHDPLAPKFRKLLEAQTGAAPAESRPSTGKRQ